MAWLRRILFLLVFPVAAFGQGARYDNFVIKPLNTGGLTAVSGALITVCTSAGTGTPCTPKVANIYSDEALTTPIVGTGGAGTTNSDSGGNFGFYAAPGSYIVTVTGTGITSYTIKLVLPAVLNANNVFKQLQNTNWYADQYCSGSLDVGLCINNTLAAIPTVGSYKYGTIRLDGFAPGTAWVWNTLVTVSSPGISIRNETGTMLQITASVLTGDHLRINTSPFISSLAGNFGGFALVGGSQSNAVCIHMGDIIGAKLIDVRCSNFSGTGAVGLWLDNVTNFTERIMLDKVHLDSCTKGIKITNTGNAAGTASFGHMRWYSVWINTGANQTGISYESGTLYSGTFNITANLSATTSTAVAISGLAYAAGPSTAWTGSLLNLNAETSAGSGTLFNTAAGSSVLVGGVVTTGGGLTNTGTGTLNIYPGNAITNADFSNTTFAAGVLVIGGTPQATNIPQFNANSVSTVAGVTASNYYLLRAGVGGLEAHDTSGNVGLAGNRIAGTEAACAGATAAVDVLCFDSVSHGLKASYNNSAFSNVALNPPLVAGTTDLGTTALPFGNLWLGTAATNNFKFQPAATSGARIVTMADPLSPTTVGMPFTIASGTSTLTVNAALAAVTSQAAITTAGTGILTTDAIEWAYATAPTAGDSLCHVSAYVTAGNVNFVRTNPTAAAQSVSAIVINWRVVR